MTRAPALSRSPGGRRRVAPRDAGRTRTAMAAELRAIMRPRTLANSHPVLASLLAPGMSVLDVGCGTGVLTCEIARRVHPGRVVGLDLDPAVIRTARNVRQGARSARLVFAAGDIRESRWDSMFDLVNAVRVLLWISDPERAIAAMARAATSRGYVVLRDTDHDRAEWMDAPPSWIRFHRAFLDWRRAAGLDNAIARRLPALCESHGLDVVTVTEHATTVRAGDPGFFRIAGHWRLVVESRGRQLVAGGHLTEQARRAALDDYTRWMQRREARHTAHDRSVVARRSAMR